MNKTLLGLSGKHYKYTQGHFWVNVIRRESGQVFCRYHDLLIYRLIFWEWKDKFTKTDRGKWTLELLKMNGDEVWHMDENEMPGWVVWLRRTYKRTKALFRLLGKAMR